MPSNAGGISQNDKIFVIGNEGYGWVGGVAIASAAAIGVGRVSVKDNIFHNLVIGGAATPVGVSVNVTAGALASLDVTGNRINTATYGTQLTGTVTVFNYFGNSYQTMATAEYDDSGATITTKTWGDTGIFFDAANDRLGIGTTAPNSILDLTEATPLLTFSGTSGFRGHVFRNSGSDFARDRANGSTGEFRHEIGLSGGFGGFHTFYCDAGEIARILVSALRLVSGAAATPSLGGLSFTTTGLYWDTNLLGVSVNATQAFQIDNTASATASSIMVSVNGTMKRVNVGAADSGGAGQKLLTVAN